MVQHELISLTLTPCVSFCYLISEFCLNSMLSMLPADICEELWGGLWILVDSSHLKIIWRFQMARPRAASSVWSRTQAACSEQYRSTEELHVQSRQT